ncbi:uncharacterized protein LOC132946120 [Metopolophium dirhodum]|uniref:uncharacterized protein LOC132946120 n=1 Tax=Metopolophium dirhodum TaxID=44670 RepID=UPI00298F4F63|nr:uncharacterized protein LOC132946120 [Metopolophium dirhodum]
MPTICAVFGCGNKTLDKSLSFYRFPKVKVNAASDLKTQILKQRTEWLNALHRTDVHDSQLKNMRICSIHFKSGKPANYNDDKNPDWIPTLSMGYNSGRSKATTPAIKRYNRASRRMELKPTQLFPNTVQLNVVDSSEHSMSIDVPNDILNDGTEESGTACNTDLKLNDINELENLRDKCSELQNQVDYFNLSEKTFIGREKMLTYYTGLESMAVFNLVLDHIKHGLTANNQRLNEFQKLLLCLMKLRLNVPFTDLGYRFNVTCSTASIIFRKVIILLEHMFKNLIYWPDREALRSTMPRSFFNIFGNSVAVIIDCFEIAIEKPSNLKARAQTWSSYKNKNTVKYLIAITPQGSISYISDGWDGRVSDKHITENCNFLNNLIPGDVVLADRGFTINESVGFHCATLKTPAFTKGLPQLHPCSVEETRKIASVRIHVERIIGLTRSKF